MLITRAEKRSKNEKNEDISIIYNKQTVPSMELEKQSKQCSGLYIIGATA
jgi:hypothetical protein